MHDFKRRKGHGLSAEYLLKGLFVVPEVPDEKPQRPLINLRNPIIM